MSDPLRFFVPAASLQDDDVVISGEPFHHLRNVLRIKPGATLLLQDGRGLCCLVELLELHPQEAIARVRRRWQEKEPALSIALLQALPKGDKFELILQKGTELGVSSFQPVVTEHAVPTLHKERLRKREQRWQRIMTEAARQSRRNFLPELKPLQELRAAVKQASDDLKLVLWEAGSVRLAEALPSEQPKSISLLVGPEGGFTEQEIHTITSAGFQPVHLGPRILRTETAGLAATPILQYLYGDWHMAPVHSNPNQHEENL